MKILKQLTVVAVAAAVLLTGCQNSFTGTSRDVAVLAEINKSATTSGLTVSAAGAGLTNTKNQQITITYSEPVDQATILSSLTIRTLTAGTAATAASPAIPYAQGATITPTLQYVSGNTATLSLDLSSVTAGRLEVYIDSTKLTARNGALKLDMDGDTVKGEGQDDDYYADFAIGQSLIAGSATIVPVTVIAGGSRDPRVNFSLTSLGFGSGTATSTSIWSATLGVAAGDTTNYGTMLDGAIAIEKYVPAANSAGSWTAVTKIGVYTPATATYVATFGPAVEGDVYRVRVTNPAALVTTPQIQGFVQKTYRDSLLKEQLLVAPTKATVTGTSLPKELTVAEQNTVTVTSAFDSNGLNGKIYIDVPLALAGTKGIDSSSVSTSSIRIYSAANGGATQYTVFNYTGTAVFVTTNTTYPTAVTRIILSLPAEYKQLGTASWGIIVTKDLKTLGDATGTAVWARYFGDYANVNTLPSLIGSNMIAGTGNL